MPQRSAEAMINIRRILVRLCLLPVMLMTACSGPGLPVVDGLRRGRPERVLLETRYGSDCIVSHISPKALITQLIRVWSDEGITLSLQKPSDQSAKVLFTSALASGYLRLDKKSEEGMLYFVEYEYRVKIARFPSTEAQEVEVNRLADFLHSVLKAAQRPAENGTIWKD